MSAETPELSEAFAQLGKAIQIAGQALVTALSQWLEHATPAMRAFYDAVKARYQDAGAPYGDSHEGLMRWVREVGEARRLQSEAEQILEQHETLAGLRRRLGT